MDAFPYQDNPNGPRLLRLHTASGDLVEIRAFAIDIIQGGVIAIRMRSGDRETVCLSPSAWSVASVVPAPQPEAPPAPSTAELEANRQTKTAPPATNQARARGGPHPSAPPNFGDDQPTTTPNKVKRKVPDRAIELDDDDDEGFVSGE